MKTRQTEPIRYYAKVDAENKTWYFGGGWAHFRNVKNLGMLLRMDVKGKPDATLVNGPRPDWDEEYHSDCFGEYQLRPLNQIEEKELFDAIHGEEQISEQY